MLFSLSYLVSLSLTELVQEPAEVTHWVTADRLTRRTCPSTDCGAVGQLFHREGVTVFERDGDWARITGYYNGSCAGGRSEYVDSGNSSCRPSNGFKGEEFAEWVHADFLTEARPADPADSAPADHSLISGSDDYQHYADAFAAAAGQLISSGTCTAGDFRDNGGWTKSTTTYRNQPVYFIYCGGFHRDNRIYLNARTGETFR